LKFKQISIYACKIGFQITQNYLYPVKDDAAAASHKLQSPEESVISYLYNSATNIVSIHTWIKNCE
jgi:hypothetical protein